MATAAQITAEIAEINTALSQIRKAGQSYTINSVLGGTQRTVTSADYDKLVKHRNELQMQLNELNETRAFRVRSSW